jgi:apolipoprotein N-acyltransferase
MFASALLLTLAAEPAGQWYLAWFALAPWLVAVGRGTTMRGVVLRSWLAGAAYFALNLWWMGAASVSGTILLIFWLALFWALAAVLIYTLRLMKPTVPVSGGWRTAYRVLAIAIVWVACEWLRSNVMLEYPWIPLGITQSPIVLMCQVADLGGVWLISFWLALTNALVAIVWLDRHERKQWRIAGVAVACVLGVTALYGMWRLHSSPLMSGPRVMVIQSNFPHSARGTPTAYRKLSVAYFLKAMRSVLATNKADLVVLPEAEFPALNDEARRETVGAEGQFLADTYQQLLAISRDYHTALVVGAIAITNWTTQGNERVGLEKRNCVYFIDSKAAPIVSRYDKIHLVRFGERAMLTTGPDWLRRLTLAVSAARAQQPLKAGSWSELQPFRLGGEKQIAPAGDDPDRLVGPAAGNSPEVRFVAPICLENIDPTIVAQMIWSAAPPGKRADFITNLSNDGAFAVQERYQHFQTSIFRCIENRAPMVRCSNTGISAFIDSSGRVMETIAPNKAGFAIRQIELDGRVTFYMRHGDVFAFTCIGLVAAAAASRIVLRFAGGNWLYKLGANY